MRWSGCVGPDALVRMRSSGCEQTGIVEQRDIVEQTGIGEYKGIAEQRDLVEYPLIFLKT